jgi:hypothetical protein
LRDGFIDPNGAGFQIRREEEEEGGAGKETMRRVEDVAFIVEPLL